MLRHLFLIISLCLPTACSRNSHAQEGQYGIVGQTAPELEAESWIDESGQARPPFKLASHRGKIVILEFFQSWCPGCHSHGLPTLKLLVEAFAEDPRAVFAAVQTVFEGHHTNTAEKLIATQKRHRLSIPMGHDAGDESSGNRSKVMQAYRTGGTPWIVIINPAGQVLYNGFHVDADKTIAFIQSLLDDLPPADSHKRKEAEAPQILNRENKNGNTKDVNKPVTIP